MDQSRTKKALKAENKKLKVDAKALEAHVSGLKFECDYLKEENQELKRVLKQKELAEEENQELKRVLKQKELAEEDAKLDHRLALAQIRDMKEELNMLRDRALTNDTEIQELKRARGGAH
jgi:hypothetical protein